MKRYLIHFWKVRLVPSERVFILAWLPVTSVLLVLQVAAVGHP